MARRRSAGPLRDKGNREITFFAPAAAVSLGRSRNCPGNRIGAASYFGSISRRRSVGPGFFLARKLLGPSGEARAALGLSLLGLYLSSFVIFALHALRLRILGVTPRSALPLLACHFRDLTGVQA